MLVNSRETYYIFSMLKVKIKFFDFKKSKTKLNHRY